VKDEKRAQTMKEAFLFRHRTAIGGIVFVCLLAGAVQLVEAEGADETLSRVTAEEARQAITVELRTRGIAENDLPRVSDIELPLAVPARAGASLKVSSMCWDGNSEEIRVRLECREAGACLPFLAYLRMASHEQAFSCQLPPREHHRHVPPRASEPVVRVGAPVTAVMVAAGMRMTAAVTCLDRGARGEIVRVRGGEGRIFRARVAGPALVQVLE